LGSNGLLSQDDVVMLDEHYRSKPEIIAFSNQEFYGGNLRIMTEKPKQNKSVSIEVHQVENGTRVKGVNEVEVDAIIIHLQKLLEDQQRLPPMNRQSIGVLSFFREQAEAIEKQLTKTFTLQTLLAFKIRATTPYGFQGEERDIMLISCALDEDGPAGAYRYLDRPDVFNVSITRARHKQIIFTSAFEHQMPENSLLKKYLQYISGIQTELPHLAKHRAQYISTISKEMLSHDIQVVADYAIAGVAMDLVLLHKGHVLVLDLIGFPGEYQDVHHLERYKIFDRAELVMFPLSFNAWTYQKPTVIEQIKKAFERIHEQSIKNVSIEYQTNLWKKLLPIDPPIAQKFRQIEYKLIELNMTDDLLQLNVLVGVYQEFVLTLLDSLDRLELTYMRYKELAVVMVNKVLSSFHSLVSSQKEGQSTDDLRLTHHHKQQQVIEKLTATIMHLKQLHEDDGMNEEVNLALKGMDELNDQFKN
ncbi:MAG: DEAD/DEAH box helicase, partial [Marinicella sp.]